MHIGVRGAVLAAGIFIAGSVAPTVLQAQETTGSLQGRVLLPDGAPAVGAQLTLMGSHMQGPRMRVPGPDGFFQFLALPPGDYALRVNRIGASPLAVDSIRVDLGRATGLGAIVLEAIPVALSGVRVVASRVTLDPASTTAGGVLQADDYGALPTDRDWRSLITILPQVNESYRGDAANAGGASGQENEYFVDGVNVTGERAGGTPRLPWNFVRAVDVKTQGYEAQFGRALGAVVNAITWSGTNDFESSAFAFVQPSALSLDPRPLPGVSPGRTITYDAGVRASGPITRDRLWYSVALNPRVDQEDKEIIGFGTHTDRTTTIRFATKLNWRAAPWSDVELSVFGDPSSQDAVGSPPPGILTVSNPEAVQSRRLGGGSVASLRATARPNQSLLIDMTVARQGYRMDEEPFGALGDEPNYIDYVTQSVSGGRGRLTRQHMTRTSLGAKASWWLRQHTIVGGAEFEGVSVASTDRPFGSPGGSITRWDASVWSADSMSLDGTVRSRLPAVYLQDSWRITDRVTLNAGLRWSGQFFVDQDGNVAQRSANEWQPRAGFSWLLDQLGRQRVFGSFGRFYQELSMNIAVTFLQDFPVVVRDYDADPRNPGVAPVDSTDWTTLASWYSTPVPGLKADNLDEVTLGYERVIGSDAKLTVRAVRRAVASSFQFAIDVGSPHTWVLGTPGEGDLDFLPPPRRTYTALEVALDGRWRALDYRASYVLSRTWGNYSGQFGHDGGPPGQNLAQTFDYQAANSTGYLPTDRRHIVKFSGAWESDFGLTAGAIVTAETGTPINDFGSGPFGPGLPRFLAQRGSVGRTPSLWNLDLRLAWALPARNGLQTSLLADLIHVGNPRGTTRVDEVHYNAQDDSGNQVNPNPRYRQPIGYQPPMAARVGLEVKW